jgi:hypothetical protein
MLFKIINHLSVKNTVNFREKTNPIQTGLLLFASKIIRININIKKLNSYCTIFQFNFWKDQNAGLSANKKTY